MLPDVLGVFLSAYPAGAALVDVQDTVEYCITGAGYNSATPTTSTGPGGGWSLWDAAAGTGKRAYAAANAPDGSGATSNKYVVLDYSTSGYLCLTVWESWNASTHVGVNQANATFSVNTAYSGQRIDLTNGGALYVFTSARYLAIVSQTLAGIGSATYGSGVGCFEVERANVQDTVSVGFPPYVWLNLGFAYAVGVTYFLGFPRGPYSNCLMVSDSGHSSGPNNVGMFAADLGTNFWTGKYTSQSLRVGTTSNSSWGVSAAVCTSEIRGRIYGIKWLALSAGAFMDQAVLNCDASGFLSDTGTAVLHNILTITGTSGTGIGRVALPV